MLWFLKTRKAKQQEFGMVGHVTSTTRKQKKIDACFCSFPFSSYIVQGPSQGMMPSAVGKGFQSN